MKLILTKDDLIDIVKKGFNGINSVDILIKDDNVIAELDVNMVKFSTIAVQTGTIATNVNMQTAPVVEQERKLVVVKNPIDKNKQKQQLEQAEQMNQQANDTAKARTMSRADEERNIAHLG